jgi:hypothetical protein
VVVKKDPTFSLYSEDAGAIVRRESSKNVDNYEILVGMESGKYLQKIQKNSLQENYVFHDLIEDETYFVRVLAKDSLGNTVFDYGEKSVVMGESSFHSAPSPASPQPYPQWITQTGPKLFLFIGAIFFIASGVILARRKEY